MTSPTPGNKIICHPWVDVTRPILPGIAIWPGDPAYMIEPVCSIHHGDECNVSRLTLSTHTGTHVDAPNHFIDAAPAIDQFPISAMTGHAVVIQINDPVSIKPPHLHSHQIPAHSHVLFKTRNESIPVDSPFREDYVYLEPEAAHYLREKNVALVGIDYMSVDKFNAPGEPVHHCLLGAGIWIIENLDLTQTPAGDYDIICLPLKLASADAAPARVLLKKQ